MIKNHLRKLVNRDERASGQSLARNSSGILTRRTLLRGLGWAGFAGLLDMGVSGCQPSSPKTHSHPKNEWALAEQIRNNVRPPEFPNRVFDIRQFGATISSADNSSAIKAAIEACHQAGGGKVLVTQGAYSCGAIHLLSNVNLHVDEGASLVFLTDVRAYLPVVMTRWEGMEMMGLSPLIYAYRQTNIAITGKGILDGQADDTHWWPWKGVAAEKKFTTDSSHTQQKARAALQRDVEKNTPVRERVYAEDAYFRPPFIQPYECKNILIKDITIKNAPFWLVNPVLCENVTVDAVTAASLGPNNDGCDPESCKNVVIKNCFFDTGDDCIAIKSGRNEDGRRINIPSENILISNCKMRNGHGGVVIGSEISGGVRNVFVENCEMSSHNLERGIRIKTNSVRGGTIENIYFRSINIGEVQTAIVIDFQYEEGDVGKFTPTVRNINIEKLTCEHAHALFQVRGYERSLIDGLRLRDCEFHRVERIGVLEQLNHFNAESVVVNGIQLKI